jgi:hypothetical protein
MIDPVDHDGVVERALNLPLNRQSAIYAPLSGTFDKTEGDT